VCVCCAVLCCVVCVCVCVCVCRTDRILANCDTSITHRPSSLATCCSHATSSHAHPRHTFTGNRAARTWWTWRALRLALCTASRESASCEAKKRDNRRESGERCPTSLASCKKRCVRLTCTCTHAHSFRFSIRCLYPPPARTRAGLAFRTWLLWCAKRAIIYTKKAAPPTPPPTPRIGALPNHIAQERTPPPATTTAAAITRKCTSRPP
jgi:hypothetical protein